MYDDTGMSPPGARDGENRRTVAERPILGSMLTATPAYDVVGEVSKVLNEADFYLLAHAKIFAAILSLHGRDLPTNAITVAQELDRAGELVKCGGHGYMHKLVDVALPGASAPYYAELAKGMGRLDLLAQTGQRAANRAAVGDPEQADEIIAAHLAEVEQLAATGGDMDDDFGLFGDGLEDHVDGLEADDVAPFAVTGFSDLDALMKIEEGQLLLAAGRPAMGKSAFALGVATATAATGRPVVLFSLEMGRKEVTNRVLAAQSRVEFNHLKRGKSGMVDEDWFRLAKHLPRLRDLPLWIDYRARTSPSRIRSRAKTVAKMTGKSPLLILDYFGLVESDRNGKRYDSKYAETSDISRELKLIPRELDCAMLALAQLNRGPEQRTDHTPLPSDLRDTGALEQDADAVILLHREDYYEKASARAGESDLILAKHRNGATSTITVAHQFHFSRFIDMAAD